MVIRKRRSLRLVLKRSAILHTYLTITYQLTRINERKCNPQWKIFKLFSFVLVSKLLGPFILLFVFCGKLGHYLNSNELDWVIDSFYDLFYFFGPNFLQSWTALASIIKLYICVQETVQDFLCKLGMKPQMHVHIGKKSFFH